MNTTTEYGKALRKCGACDKHVATTLDAKTGESFVAHLDRGRLCPGSRNAAAINLLWSVRS